MNNLQIRRNIIFAALGFAAMVAQIVVMRRLIVVFGGNELVVGATFAGWLGASGIGNVVAGRFADRTANTARALAILIFALALAIPATVAAAGLVKAFCGIAPPVMPGFLFIVLATIAVLSPIGFLIGMSFTFACKLPGRGIAADIGLVYALDVAGAACRCFILNVFCDLRNFFADHG